MVLWSLVLILLMVVPLPSLPHLHAAVGAALPSNISPGTVEPMNQTITVYASKAARKKEATSRKPAKGAGVSALSEDEAAELAEAEAEAEAAIAAALAELDPDDPADQEQPDDSRRPQVKAMIYCHHCGAKLMSSRSVYCNTCGKPLAEVARS